MKRKTRKQLPKLIALGITLTVCVAGMGYMMVQAMGQKVVDELGCYDGVYQKVTAVVVDLSEPRFDNVQSRSLQTYFKQTYDGLAFNERLSVFTTAGNEISSVVTPSFSVCGQAKNSQELEEVGAPAAQSGYLKRQKEKLFNKIVKPKLDKLLTLNPNESQKQLYESPILEMIKSVVRDAKLESGDRLIVISDMIQNSESARFCRKKGDMPSFSTFKKRSVYQGRLKPRSIDNVEVEVLMLLRKSYGQSGLDYCSSEDEIRDFWIGYFKENFGTIANFIRIRQGFSSQ